MGWISRRRADGQIGTSEPGRGNGRRRALESSEKRFSGSRYKAAAARATRHSTPWHDSCRPDAMASKLVSVARGRRGPGWGNGTLNSHCGGSMALQIWTVHCLDFYILCAVDCELFVKKSLQQNKKGASKQGPHRSRWFDQKIVEYAAYHGVETNWEISLWFHKLGTPSCLEHLLNCVPRVISISQYAWDISSCLR